MTRAAQEYEFSSHARDMLAERAIREERVYETIAEHEIRRRAEDGTIRFARRIEELGGRYLRVVVNPAVKPRRIVTMFFDRRLRGRQ